MLKVFVLKGVKYTGKTATLKLVNELLKKKYPSLNRIDFKQSKNAQQDFWGIYDLNVNGKMIRVGLETGGDDYRYIYEDVKRFLLKKCEIIFCACHPSGKTLEAINTYKYHGGTVTFIETIKEPDKTKSDAKNKADALKLIQMAGL